MADPFDVLGGGDVPVAPDPSFARGLRRRLAAAVAPKPPPPDPPAPQSTLDRSTTVTATPSALTPGLTASVTPYLSVRRASEALAFYAAAFGAVETMRITQDDGRIGHAEITIGGARIQLADEFPEAGSVGPESVGGTSVMLSLDLDDVDIDASFDRAVAAGATVLRPVADQFYGRRGGQVLDPFGHRWSMATVIEQLTDEEIVRRAPGVSDGGSGGDQVQLDERAPSGEAWAGVRSRTEGVGDLGYFTLGVPDAARGKAFYGALLGWRFEPDDVQADAVYVHIAGAAPPGGLYTGHAGLNGYFRVADIHAAVDKVRVLGGRAGEPDESPSGWSAECQDDQGQPLHLWQPAPGH